MKIAVHEPGGLEATERYISTSLGKLGVETRMFRYPKWNWKQGLLSFRPDWILFSSIEAGYRLVSMSEIATIRKTFANAKIAFWTFDPMGYADRENWFVPLGRQVDLVLMKERGLLHLYREQGINAHYLDQGAFVDMPFGDTSEPQWKCDVAFVGNLPVNQPGENERVELVREVSKRFHLKIWSHDRKPWDRWGLGSYWMPRLLDKDWPKLAASAAIVVAIDLKQDCEGYWSNRVYKALGSGCFFLNRYVPGFETAFKAGEHLDTFRSTGEAIDKIRSYLAAPERQKQIRRAGYDYVHSSHTYNHRAREFLKIIADYSGSKSFQSKAPSNEANYRTRTGYRSFWSFALGPGRSAHLLSKITSSLCDIRFRDKKKIELVKDPEKSSGNRTFYTVTSDQRAIGFVAVHRLDFHTLTVTDFSVSSELWPAVFHALKGLTRKEMRDYLCIESTKLLDFGFSER